jgi:hypothetical protein
MATYQKTPDGIRYHPHYGRVMEHRGYSTAIFWNKDMLDYLRRHYPTTLNEELAGILGVSPRTMIRKARQLGLQKDKTWLASVWEERRLMAHAASKLKGNPGAFKKGEHRNPDGEFKTGHRLPEEQQRKRAESMKQWHRRHPLAARKNAMKAWATRRKNENNEQKETIRYDAY